MNLLIVTQKVDREDENLGAFYYWFEELARHAEHVTIIASSVGVHNLPSNVTIVCLEKHTGTRRLARIRKFFELFSYHYAQSDAVFFHQIPEFVIAAAPFLLSLKKRSVLWYAHKSVTWRLKIAEKLVDFIATSSPEGFRLPSKKVVYVGQAINTDLFKPIGQHDTTRKNSLRLISVGRIAPVKNYEQLIEACAAGDALWPEHWSLTLVGGPILARDYAYLESLKRLAVQKNISQKIDFSGPARYSEIPAVLGEHDMFVNLSRTGSLDKAVFEAMACGLTVLTSNEAYRAIVPDDYFLEHANAEFIAERIKQLAMEPRPNMALSRIVSEHHSLAKTISRILGLLTETEQVTNGRSVPLYITRK